MIDQIETIFERQLDAIASDDQHLSVTVKSRSPARQEQTAMDGNGKSTSPSLRTFQFPGTNEKEAWRYSQHRANFVADVYMFLTTAQPLFFVFWSLSTKLSSTRL